jgi:hypothetical protein
MQEMNKKIKHYFFCDGFSGEKDAVMLQTKQNFGIIRIKGTVFWEYTL